MGNVSITKNNDINMAVYSFEGDTAYDGIREEIDRYYSGPLSKYKICDFTKSDLSVSSREVVLLAEQIRLRGRARRGCYDAIVVPSLLYYGFARMYVAYAEYTHKDPEALKILIFRSMDQAVAAMTKLAAEAALKT